MRDFITIKSAAIKSECYSDVTTVACSMRLSERVSHCVTDPAESQIKSKNRVQIFS